MSFVPDRVRFIHSFMHSIHPYHIDILHPVVHFHAARVGWCRVATIRTRSAMVTIPTILGLERITAIPATDGGFVIGSVTTTTKDTELLVAHGARPQWTMGAKIVVVAVVTLWFRYWCCGWVQGCRRMGRMVVARSSGGGSHHHSVGPQCGLNTTTIMIITIIQQWR